MISGKPHFGPDLGLLGPFLVCNFFKVSALLDAKHCPKLQSCAISGKLMMQTQESGEKPNAGPILGS